MVDSGLPLSGNVPPLDSKERRKRKREGIVIVFLSLLFVVLTIAEFQLTTVSNSLPFVNSIFFFGLLNINIVILIALLWLVFRNIGKLFIERRRKILGARLKTKLVIAFFAFSIIPTLVLFVISAMYINSSFDKWFSLKIQNTLQASLEITHIYYKNAGQTAMHFAERLAVEVGQKYADKKYSESLSAWAGPPHWLNAYLSEQRENLALDAIEFYADPLDERLMSQRSPVSDKISIYPRLTLDHLQGAFAGEHVSKVQHVGEGDLIRCMVPARLGGIAGRPIVGVVVVDSYIPVSLVNKVGEIANVFDDYKDTNPLKYPMKTTYLVILIMITLVILVVAIWIGLYMARELTVPVERLVLGAQAVGAGNLDVTIEAVGHDEIAVLVQSFNKMTEDLRENRRQLVQAGTDLEKRRLQLEAVLANVGTGVVAVDSSGVVTTFNRAASNLLQLRPETVIGQPYREIFQKDAPSLGEVLDRALADASVRGREDSLPEVGQWNQTVADGIVVLAAIATPLRESEMHWGAVVVIDDITHLVKGQREMAWREVARRIAHEIKNPLTPIKLSAQRLQRQLSNFRGREGNLLQECTDTIIKHTDELKEMVNEFSNFARFPEATPAPHDLNGALAEVMTLYQQAHSDIVFKTVMESKLPIFEFDRDQIKRVLINLIDNAVSALKSVPPTERKCIEIATHYNEILQIAVIDVGDNGPGMSEEVRDRVFEPYFSTKTEGTGLGLAIAKRIINDHDGFIRVHSSPGEGTQFLIELPTAVRHGIERRRSRLGAVQIPRG